MWPGLKAHWRNRHNSPLTGYDQGHVIGGGSSVMGMVALRGIPDDYDEWEAVGARGWAWNDVLPYFRKLENDFDFAGKLHGRDGPTPIRRTPYEQWTLLTRESLRITYIDALDRLSRIQLSVGTLDDCIATGHRMLDVDPCSEDAHRLLMRCYASLGRGYQALRQYEFCCRVLKQILGTEPLPETARLYRAIRTGSLQVPAPTD